jgi:hypothetical protein
LLGFENELDPVMDVSEDTDDDPASSPSESNASNSNTAVDEISGCGGCDEGRAVVGAFRGCPAAVIAPPEPADAATVAKAASTSLSSSHDDVEAEDSLRAIEPAVMHRFALVASLLVVAVAALDSRPEQLHLSLTERVGEMRVMWVRPTLPLSEAPSDEGCVYGPSEDAMTTYVQAASHTYSDGGFKGSIFNVILETEVRAEERSREESEESPLRPAMGGG